MSDTERDPSNGSEELDFDIARVVGLPNEYRLFTTEAGEAGGRIVYDDELLGPLYSGAEASGLGLTGLSLIAKAGSAVTITFLLEKDLLKPEALELIRGVKHVDPEVSPLPFYGVSEEARDGIHSIVERSIHLADSDERRGE